MVGESQEVIFETGRRGIEFAEQVHPELTSVEVDQLGWLVDSQAVVGQGKTRSGRRHPSRG